MMCKDVLKSSKAALVDSYETHLSKTEQKVAKRLQVIMAAIPYMDLV